jgi:nitronate monooxygenase
MSAVPSPLADLLVSAPVVAAPMAGGPSTPGLVAAAAAAGGLGFLAAGYQTAQALAQQMGTTRGLTDRFGVNLFVPNPVPVDPIAFRVYAEALGPHGKPYGLDLHDAQIVEDDDAWQEKVDLLVSHPVPIVSFTFGIPDRGVVRALRRAGTVTAQTVTCVPEAVAARDVGVDVLVVQASTAGGHWGTLTPERPPEQLPLTELVRAVRGRVPLPVLAAGGLGTPADVTAVLRAGADAAVVGTVLLAGPESGASAVHKAALLEGRYGSPTLTRAFSGRPARALPNTFVSRFDPIAPLGYPAIHHLTSPLRKAAALAGDPEMVNLWAGTGYRHASDSPAAATLRWLSAEA